MRVVIEAAAYSDVDAVSDFYDQQEAGVGLYFVQFARTARSLETTGGIHVRRHGFHFCLIERFPVALYYQVENNEVRIVAVLDCRRSPRWIRRQLRGR